MKKEGEGYFIFRSPKGTAADFNANLNLSTESIADDTGVKTTADYARLGLEQFKKTFPAGLVVQEPVEVTIHGRDFSRMVTVVPQEKIRIVVVQFMYFHPRHKTAFVWTLMDLSKRSLKDVALLESIPYSVRFD